MFNHDAAAPTTGGGSTLLPAGNYDLVITKAEDKDKDGNQLKSSKGHPMVKATCEVINNPDFNGSKVFHNVTFLPKDAKGAGMSSHFLKCINQPYQGDVSVDPEAWIGEKFKSKIQPREYEKKDGTKAKTNDIKEVMASDGLPF